MPTPVRRKDAEFYRWRRAGRPHASPQLDRYLCPECAYVAEVCRACDRIHGAIYAVRLCAGAQQAADAQKEQMDLGALGRACKPTYDQSWRPIRCGNIKVLNMVGRNLFCEPCARKMDQPVSFWSDGAPV